MMRYFGLYDDFFTHENEYMALISVKLIVT